MTVILFLLTVAPLTLIIYSVVEYLIDTKNLRAFSSPEIAGLSDLWALRYHWTNSRYRAVHDAHRMLGPIARIQPRHLSFTDPRALKDIYGYSSSIMKAPSYDNIAGEYHDVANATDRAEHSRKRRIMSHVSSHKHILTMEELIDDVLGSLVKALDERLDQQLDLRYWFNLFTFDAISNLAFSQPFNFLETGSDLTLCHYTGGSTNSVNLVRTFHSTTTYAAFVGHANQAWSVSVPAEVLRYGQGTAGLRRRVQL